MTCIARDERTGLALQLPEGWRIAEQTALPLVLIDDHPEARATFVPNAIATVVELLEDDDIESFTKRNSLAWAEQMNGTITHVGTAPTELHDGREVLGLYNDGGIGVAVHTLLFAEQGLGTRIDISSRVWDASEMVGLAQHLLEGFTPPSSAPAAQATAEQLSQLLENEVNRG